MNVALTVYYLLVIVYGYREKRLKKARVWLFAPPLILGFGLSFAVIPFVDIGWSVCQFDVYPNDEYLWSLLLFGLVPILGALCMILALLLFIYCKVRSQMVRGQKWNMSRFKPVTPQGRPEAPQRVSAQQRLERDVFWQCVLYAAAFCITWPILAVAEIEGNNFDMPMGFFVVVALVAPIQGFNNSLCYFRPFRRKKTSSLRGPHENIPSMTSSIQKRFNRVSHFLRSSVFRAVGSTDESSFEDSAALFLEGDPIVYLANLEPCGEVFHASHGSHASHDDVPQGVHQGPAYLEEGIASDDDEIPLAVSGDPLGASLSDSQAEESNEDPTKAPQGPQDNLQSWKPTIESVI